MRSAVDKVLASRFALSYPPRCLMAFQDDLRAYLERIATQAADPPRSWFNPDVRVHRQHVLRELVRLEKTGRSKAFLLRAHTQWSKDVADFAAALGTELVNGLCYQQPVNQITQFINIAISRDMNRASDATTGSFVNDAELDRLSHSILDNGTKRSQRIEQYALEIRAVRRAGERYELTPLGRIALELPDRDVVRWLLTAEAIQSRGSDDPWRLSRKSAAELHARPRDWIPFHPDEPASFPVSSKILRRLADMDLSSFEDVENDETGEPLGEAYEMFAQSLPLLAEIAFRPDTPFAVFIEALLSDETEVTLGPHRPITARISAESAALATTRHARMVTHEIRNALVPVQGALERLYRDAERRNLDDLLSKHRESIDQGIERIFQFIKEMMEVAERGAESPESFLIDDVIREGITAVDEEFGGQHTINFMAVPERRAIKGYRHRFLLVIRNLLRNAAQANAAAPRRIHVQMEWIAARAEVIITVEDNGPGVPPEHRTNIFKQGFSLRLGGTGQGLALVREVIESEMNGHVTCEESSLGGARFVLRLPLTGRQSS